MYITGSLRKSFDAVKKLFKITVSGRVQGVFYRDSARQTAQELGIAGFVRNQPDGTVYIEAEGEEKYLRELVRWCRRGPQWAHVESVEVEKGEPAGYTEFESKG
ncbi:MAG: acylphosphatase [Proteobacteria bacterium]|nr:acylphosphatase [Pseudomonadota bacterium]